MKQLARHTRAYDVGRLLHAALSVGALHPVGIWKRCDFVAVQLVSLAHLLRHLQHLAQRRHIANYIAVRQPKQRSATSEHNDDTD